MLDILDTSTVKPIPMKIVAARIEKVDSRNNNKDSSNDQALYTKLQLNTATTNTLMTSSPTLTDSSEEFDVSLDDDIVDDDVTDIDSKDDDDVNTNHPLEVRYDVDAENELTIITEQPSGIDTSEVADHSSSAHLPRTEVQPKRSSLIHSMEESRKSRSFRQREKLRSTTVDDISFSSRAVDDEDDALIQQQNEVQPSVGSTHVPKLNVHFSSVTIRDYPRSIGDNPASSCGPSVSIGWKHESECTVPLDEYEENRSPRRLGREMIIPVKIREELLREAGYSRADIMKCIRDINIIRGQRRRTYETLHLQSFQLLTERISRKAWNVLTLGEYKRKERATLQELSHHRTETSPVTSTSIKTVVANHGNKTNERSSPTTTSTTTVSNYIDDDSSSSYM